MNFRSLPFQKEFLDQISDAVIIIDNDHLIAYVNPEAERRYGLSAAGAIGRPLTEMVRYEWLDAETETRANEALKVRGYWRGENIHVTHDGRRLHVESSVTRLLAQDGSQIGLMAVIRDVTERKRAEEELRLSHELLRGVFDSSFGHVQLFKAIRSAEGGIVDFEWVLTNKQWNDEWGDMAGKRLLAENPGVVEAGIFDKFVRVTETGEPTQDEQYYGHEQFDGWYVQSIVKLRDGCLMSTLDITERKRAEEALRASEQKYRTLFESIGEGFVLLEVVLDAEGRAADLIFRNVNPAFERHTGLRDAIGRSAREILPELEEYWYENYGRVARTGEPMRFENEAAPLGRFYEVYAFPTGAKGENRVGVIFNDVSERRRSEASERERERLRALVRGQEAERQRIARDLHDDLGQQFTALRMKLDWLGRTNGASDGAIAEIRELAAKIDAAVDRLAWDLRPAALDDLGLAIALERFVREWSGHTGITAEMLASNVAETRVPADLETNLYRIAQEALHNVHKHAAARRVDVMLQGDAGRLRLVVADDGRGFDPEEVHDGGLGLTSMRERASLIGGDIHIESAPNAGTSIHITVPFSPVTGSDGSPRNGDGA